MVIRIGEGPTAADRHEARVPDLREDHGWHSCCLHPPNTLGRRTRDQARPQAKPANPVADPQARRLHDRSVTIWHQGSPTRGQRPRCAPVPDGRAILPTWRPSKS
jgi:hypothetical protein